MARLSLHMTEHHRECDEQLSELDACVQQQDWTSAEGLFMPVRQMLETHFDVEEQLLFPRFEHATGLTSGPTAVMRGEHAQMRALLEVMALALRQRDGDTFLGESETLFTLLQQHNMKEESMLYPMCEARLHAELETFFPQMLARLHGATDENC